MANLEIRVRREDDTESTYLAEIPFRNEAIDSVIPLIQAWGLSYEGDGGAGENVYGRFVVQKGKGFFEVVIPAT